MTRDLGDYIDNCPAHLTNIAGNKLHDGLSNLLEEGGYTLSKPQIRILLYLFQQDGLEQKHLRNLIKLSKISVVKIINKLEEENLVLRVPNENDLRNNRLYLTPLAKKMKEPLLDLIDLHKSTAFKDISSADLNIFKSVLKKMLSNMTP